MSGGDVGGAEICFTIRDENRRVSPEWRQLVRGEEINQLR